MLTRQFVLYTPSIGFRSREGSQIAVGFEGCDLLSEKFQFALGLLQPDLMLVAADGAMQPFGFAGQPDGFVEMQRDGRCVLIEIGIARCCGGWLGCRLDAVEAGANFGCKQQIRVAICAGVTFLDTCRASISLNDP